ncbi:hypothetical protein ABK040_000891 [Willaertia magna]
MSQNNNNNNNNSSNFDTVNHWDKTAENYEGKNDAPVAKILTFFSNELIKRAELNALWLLENDNTQKQQFKYLDIATGTGILAFLLENKIINHYLNNNNNNSIDSNCDNNSIDNSCQQQLLHKQLHLIEGIDYSEGMLQIAERKKKEKNSNLINFQQMNGMNLKFNDNTFDRIFSNFGIIFYSDIVKGLKEIYRVLKPNGGKAIVDSWTEKYPTKATVDVLHNYKTNHNNNHVIDNQTENKEEEKEEKKTYEFLQLADINNFKKYCIEAGFLENNIKIEVIKYNYEITLKEYIDDMILRLSYLPFSEEEFIERVKKVYHVNNLEDKIVIESEANVATLIK